MLRFLRGKVISVTDSEVVLDVNGLGFALLCSGGAARLCREGEQAMITTQLQVSEAGVALFGFTDEKERNLFLKLTTVKGVGGKMAMNLLRGASPDRIVGWILSSDVASMMTIPGIGRKTAERLCFEMRRHLEGEEADFVPEKAPGAARMAEIAMEALRSLGFAQGDIGPVFRKMKEDGVFEADQLTEEKILRLALKELKRN